MPFLGYEEWEKSTFGRYNHVDVEIPLDDLNAYRLYPDLRHLFYKPLVLDMLGVYNAPSGSPDPGFPVIQKPAFNPWGMGMGVEAFDHYDPNKHYQPGTFIMEKYEGVHRSIDCVFREGNLEFTQVAIGHPGPGQTFFYWELSSEDPKLPEYILRHIRQYSYTGCVNIETIDHKFIEMSLRFSTQFVNLYDTSWLPNIISLYNGMEVRGLERVSNKYSVPVFVPTVSNVDLETISTLYPSLTITFDPECSPAGGERLGWFNTDDLASALQSKREIERAVDHCKCSWRSPDKRATYGDCILHSP